MKQFLLYTLFFVSVSATAPCANTDSLINLVNAATVDSVKVDLLNALSKSLFSSNPDSALSIASTSKDLAEKAGSCNL